MRAWKSVGGSTTYFLYDGSQPVCELDASGNVAATNTWGGGLLSRHAGSASTFYTFDPSGNVAQRLDSSGNVLGAYAFDAFGLRTGTDATTDPYSSFGGQYGYYADAESGLLLLGHRYYDAGTGRFINRDPLGYAGGSNLYAYAGNNPVMLADPSGFCPDGGGPGSGGSQGGGYDPTNPFRPDGTGDPNGPLTGKSGNPGFNPGSPQNDAANKMEKGFGDTLKMAVGGAALGLGAKGLELASEAAGSSPLAYGPSAGGKLEEFANATGSKTLSTLSSGRNPEVDMYALGGPRSASIAVLNAAAQTGRPIYFDLTNMEDVNGVLAGTARPNDVTSMEIRYIKDNWSSFQNVVTFYKDGAPLPGGKPW